MSDDLLTRTRLLAHLRLEHLARGTGWELFILTSKELFARGRLLFTSFT